MSASILMVGLPLDGPLPPSVDASVIQTVKAGIAASHQHAAQEGLQLDELDLGPKSDLKLFTNKLRASHYDALVIGGGIKTLPFCNTLLEVMVNAVKDVSPWTRIYFISGADDILATSKRACAEVKHISGKSS